MGYDKRDFVLAIVRNGVDVFDFFTAFDQIFQGKTYCCDLPHQTCFPNWEACHPFKEFITATIKDRISNGSINAVGHVGEVAPPHLVMPIILHTPVSLSS